MRDLIAQVRYALRFLWRTPAFTLPAVASLALGIAVNTTIFSVFNATLLRPLGDSTGGELVRIGRTARGLHEFRSLAYGEFLYLREHATSFTDIAGHQVDRIVLRHEAGTQVVTGEIVAGDSFALLGRPPLPGRSFDAESKGGFAAEAEAVISHDFWRSHFAADSAVTGRTVMLNDYPFAIVGVAPVGFHMFRVVVGSTLRSAVIGVVLGGVLAAATTRLLRALLYGLSPTDPLTFGTIAVLLLCSTLAAACIAARRGLDADPLTVLRHE